MLSIALVHHEAPCHMHTNTYIRTRTGYTYCVRCVMNGKVCLSWSCLNNKSWQVGRPTLIAWCGWSLQPPAAGGSLTGSFITQCRRSVPVSGSRSTTSIALKYESHCCLTSASICKRTSRGNQPMYVHWTTVQPRQTTFFKPMYTHSTSQYMLHTSNAPPLSGSQICTTSQVHKQTTWHTPLPSTVLTHKLTCTSTKSAAEMSSQEPVTVGAGPDGRHQQDNTFSSPRPNCAQLTHLITH